VLFQTDTATGVDFYNKRPLPASDRRRQVARHRNRGETLDLPTDLLVIGNVPPAALAAVGAATVGARVNSTGGQAMAVLDQTHRHGIMPRMRVSACMC
jgi:hypothetical protein